MTKKTKNPDGEPREYYVTIPIAGSANFLVEATSEDDAKKKAWEAIDKGEEPEIEWEYHERIVSGNVLHASCNEIEAGLA